MYALVGFLSVLFGLAGAQEPGAGSPNVWSSMQQSGGMGGGMAGPMYETFPQTGMQQTGGAGSLFGDTNMFGAPYAAPDMMGVTVPPMEFTTKPSRRQYLLKKASERKVGGKVSFNKAKYEQLQAQKEGAPQKDELVMFVDSVKKMATGFKRLEFRLTKAFKMVDKYLTTL